MHLAKELLEAGIFQYDSKIDILDKLFVIPCVMLKKNQSYIKQRTTPRDLKTQFSTI